MQREKKAVALNPKKAENHYVLSRLYAQKHQTDDANRELAEFQRDHDTAKSR